MGATLSLTIEKTYATTTCTVKATLKVKSTSGSHNNNSKQSGYITIDGTKYSFNSAFKSNTTTTLATKSKSIARGTSARDITVKGVYDTGVSPGTISVTKSGINIAALPKYTVTWNKNGGGSSTTTSVSHGKTTTFPSSAGSKTGYDWTGKWGTSASGGTLYNKGATTPAITSARTYYAQWKVKTTTVNFYDGTTKLSDKTATVTYGQSFTFPTYTKSGYVFLGWSTSSTSPTAQYASGSQVTWKSTQSSVTYYAILSSASRFYPPSISNVTANRYSLITNSLASDSTSIAVEFEWISGTYTGTKVGYENYYSKNNSIVVTAKNSSTGETFTVIEDGEVIVGNAGVMRGELLLVSPDDMVFDIKNEYLITVVITDKSNDSGSNRSAVGTAVVSQGGFTVSVSSHNNALAVFGIADNNDPGVTVYNNAKITPTQLLLGPYYNPNSTDAFVIGGESSTNLESVFTVDNRGNVGPLRYATPDPGSNWRNYPGTTDPIVLKFGHVCQLVWQSQPKTTTTMNASPTANNICCIIPEGFRPPRKMDILAQASSTRIYLITLRTSGEVELSRLRNTDSTTYVDATDTMWFPVNATWITTDLNEGTESTIPGGGGSGGGGGDSSTSNYDDLLNKPQIEGVTLVGNKTFSDLHLERITNAEIDDILSY